MVYVSKGAVLTPSDINNVHVSRCGCEYALNDIHAKLWLAGRFRSAYAENAQTQSELWKLEEMGLAEVAEPDETAVFRLLTNCVICKVNPPKLHFPLNKDEKQVWEWIKNAGFKLTISELVFLLDRNIKPDSFFFGEHNWHNLIHAIYTTETIFDGILEAKMQDAPARNRTVTAVMGLLKKKYILFV